MANTIYVTIKPSEGANICPFALGRTLDDLNVEIIKTSRLKSGAYLVQVKDEDSAEKILGVSNLDDGSVVKASLHPSLNGCKCVIVCEGLKDLADKDILKNLESQGVTGVKAKGNHVYEIVMSLPKPPQNLQVGALSIKTNKFYPRAKLCRNCYVYGHIDGDCRNKTACRKCGMYHDAKCKGAPQCRNCGGAHHPTDKKCPVWKQETAICRLMVDQGQSGKAARANYRKQHKKTYIVPPKVAPEARNAAASPAPPDAETTPKTKSKPPMEQAPSQEGSVSKKAKKAAKSKPKADPPAGDQPKPKRRRALRKAAKSNKFIEDLNEDVLEIVDPALVDDSD